MIKYDTLFKPTSHGKVQEWRIEQDGNKYRSISGQVAGKKVTSEWTVCKGKNIGRSNETSPHDQCVKEIESLYRKQYDRGYSSTIQMSAEAVRFEPMLAKKYEDYSSKMSDDVEICIQPKLDGIRCNITATTTRSRKNKDFVTVPHIREALESIFREYPDVVLDGELYNHDFKADFNEITSIVKKQKPSSADLEKSKEYMQYWIYDAFFPQEPNLSFTDRIQRLFEFNHSLPECIKFVPTYWIRKDAARQHYEEFIVSGFEGAIVRIPQSEYQQKRTSDLLKYKEMIDDEYEILDFIEGKGNLTGCAASVECIIVHAHGGSETFRAGIKGSRSYLADLWKNRSKYIGMYATIQYFNLTPGGIPRFGKMKSIRDYE